MDAGYHNPSDSKGLSGKPHPLKGQPTAGKVTTVQASRPTSKGKRK